VELGLAGRRAVVTGGSKGIGKAIAAELLAEGAAVTICSRHPEELEATAAELMKLAADAATGTVLAMPCDVTDPGQVTASADAAAAAMGGLDILVNNAGGAVFKKVADMTPEDWHGNIDLNLNGAFYCTREALPRFRHSGGGFVVNISSLAAINPFSGGAAYNASKFGLNGFTEALMLDHRHDNIRVCSIMPGSVDTEFTGDPGKARQGDTSWMIAPEDVAEAVALVLKMSPRTMISRLEMRPSRPAKK